MAKPSDFQFGEDGSSSADKSTVPSQNGMLEGMEQPQETEMDSNDESLKLTSDSEPSAEPNKLIDEKADRARQPGHDEQLNEIEGRDEFERQNANHTPESPITHKQPDGTEEILTVDGAENQEVINRLPLVWDMKYNYQPLSNPDSTRILVLLPAQKKADDLRCYMDVIHLSDVEDESQKYMALSYVWGAQEAIHMVWFGNHSLRIRPNLDGALRNLRRRDRSIRLWVDAVCIDQNDVLERNHQVQQMRDIFSAASETIIYLGPQDGGSTGDSAWDFLERHNSWALDGNRDIDRNAAAHLNEHWVTFQDIQNVERDVLSRSWFRRFVATDGSPGCQIVLSPRIHGPYDFGLWEYQRLDIVRNINISRREYLRQRGLERFLPSWRLPETFGPSQGVMDILNILSVARYQEASDPKDKIYGLVGISTGIDTADPRFAIEYRLSDEDLYIRFARNHVEATKSYDIFSYTDTATESLVKIHSSPRWSLLPSWVPNWHYQGYISYGSNRTILETLPVETPTQKKVRQSRVADGYYGLPIKEYTKTMAVRGRIIGRIEHYTLPLRLVGKSEVLFQEARDRSQDESQSFTGIMKLWTQILYFDDFALRLPEVERQVLLMSPAGWRIPAIVSPPRAEFFASHFQEARMNNPTSVEYHLYARARQTAGWSDGGYALTSYVITDKESIVDGKRLAVCAMETEPVRQLALVPSMAHEGDLVIQISGTRVPFIVKHTPGVAWPGEKVDSSTLSVPLKQTTCQLVGECLLNDFEELAEDRMDTMFVIV